MHDVVEDVFKSRTFRLLLYPEDLTHVSALSYIMDNFERYAFCCHDRDKDSEGNLIKPHWHIVLEFKNPRFNTALAKELKITKNYILNCKKFDFALEYLLHLNHPDKFQYSIDDCIGSLVGKMKDLLNKSQKSECEKVIDILNYIDDFSNSIRVSDLARYCSDIGTWDVFRRSAVIFIKCVDEHNSKFLKK